MENVMLPDDGAETEPGFRTLRKDSQVVPLLKRIILRQAGSIRTSSIKKDGEII